MVARWQLQWASAARLLWHRPCWRLCSLHPYLRLSWPLRQTYGLSLLLNPLLRSWLGFQARYRQSGTLAERVQGSLVRRMELESRRAGQVQHRMVQNNQLSKMMDTSRMEHMRLGLVRKMPQVVSKKVLVRVPSKMGQRERKGFVELVESIQLISLIRN